MNNYLTNSISFLKRNNRYILLFLISLVFLWIEMLNYEKYVSIPSIDSFDGVDAAFIDVDLIIYYLKAQRFKLFIVAVASLWIRILLVSFILYIGYCYIGSVGRQKFGQWFKISISAECVLLFYRLYIVIIRFLGLDSEIFDVNARFSLGRILNLSDTGLLTRLFNLPLSAINIMNVAYCIVLVFLVSRYFNTKITSAVKYVLSTYVLFLLIFLFLNSFVSFINA